MTAHRDRARTLGAEIIDGLEDALAYQRGELEGTKVTRATLAERHVKVTPAPSCSGARIASIRGRLNLSQPVFAAVLNVSAETVKKWEQGTRDPDGAALRLIELADAHPEWIAERISSSQAPKRRKRNGR